jgi:hypothetical protein
MKGALQGIKVIELAQIMAGPTCGMLLADMGADVLKVEKLPGGDDTRSYTEPSIKGESAAFMILNRNNRGMAVNLKHPGGLEVVTKRLALDRDPFLEHQLGLSERQRVPLDRIGVVRHLQLKLGSQLLDLQRTERSKRLQLGVLFLDTSEDSNVEDGHPLIWHGLIF